MDWLGIAIAAAAGYAWRGWTGAAIGAGAVAVIYRAGVAGKKASAKAAEKPGAPVIVLQAPVTPARADLVAIRRDRPADELERRLAQLQR